MVGASILLTSWLDIAIAGAVMPGTFANPISLSLGQTQYDILCHDRGIDIIGPAVGAHFAQHDFEKWAINKLNRRPLAILRRYSPLISSAPDRGNRRGMPGAIIASFAITRR